MPSYEGFYLKKGKPRQDADFHESILTGGNEAAARKVSNAVAKRLGLTDDEIAALYRRYPRQEKQHRAFDPNQPRDEDGKWTDGGGGDSGGSEDDDAAWGEAAHVRVVLSTGRATAKQLGYDPALVSIGAQESPDAKFTLNGKDYRAAGVAYIRPGPMRGHIKLFPKQIHNEDQAFQVTVHEVQHQKFQHALDQYRVEYEQVMREPKGDIDDVMRPDGSLRPPYDEKYPVYTAIEAALKMHSPDEFAAADGVSDYSYEYWKDWRSSGGHATSYERCLHETLAEMARLKMNSGRFPEHMGERILDWRGEDKPKPSQAQIDKNAKLWRDLYRAVDKVWALKK